MFPNTRSFLIKIDIYWSEIWISEIKLLGKYYFIYDLGKTDLSTPTEQIVKLISPHR